jgi:hypothetical protein
MPRLRRPWFRSQTTRRYQPEHFLQGLPPGVQRLARPAESTFRAAHWPPTTHVTFGIIMRVLSRGEGLTYQHCPVFLRCHSSRGERRQPGRHSDQDLEPLGGGTHISLRRTIPIAVSTSERGGGKLASGRGKPAHNHAYCVNRPRRHRRNYLSWRTGPKRAGTVTVRSNTRISRGPEKEPGSCR